MSTKPAATPPDVAPTRAQEILDAATRLFWAEGYHAVGMRRIASEIGIQTAGLYHYFPGKSEILYTICLNVTRDFVDEHLPLLYGAAPPAERLRELIRRHIVYFWHHRLRMDVALRDHRSLPPQQYDVVRGHRRRYRDAISSFILEGVRQGEFSVRTPVAATALLDMINGINNWFRDGHPYSIEELADIYAYLAVDELLGATTSKEAQHE